MGEEEDEEDEEEDPFLHRAGKKTRKKILFYTELERSQNDIEKWYVLKNNI
jgi:hypothetical protein